MTRPLMGTPEPSPEAIKASFGFVGKMAEAIPEMRGVLQTAIKEQWTTDRFLMAIADTNWYKTNGDRAREWLTLQQVDPATAQQRLAYAGGEAAVLANRLGIRLTREQHEQAALWKMMSPGISEENFSTYLGLMFDPFQDWNQLGGRAAELSQNIMEIGRAYGWDDFDEGHYNESREWLGRIMRGQDTLDGFKTRMLNYAKVKYPGLADQLLAGMTVKEIADPYLDSYSRLLEVPKSGINWSQDNQITRALQGENNVATPIYQFERELRSDPRWAKTNNARDETSRLLLQVGQDFGFIGRGT